MTQAARHTWNDDNESGPEASNRERTLLDHLRHAARLARCKCHTDLVGACAALSGDPAIAHQAAADVLMRCLSQALGRRPVLLREGEAEISDDEAWLMALARALKHGDTASATFLLHSRVTAHQRRNLVFLLQNVIAQRDSI